MYFAVSELPDAIGICAGMQDTARECGTNRGQSTEGVVGRG